jgi:hypothetical protein
VRYAVLGDVAEIYGVDRRIEQVVRRRPIP